MVFTLGSFVLVTVAVAFVSWLKTKGTDETSKDGYFLGGRSLSGLVIFGSLMMTNLSAEQLVGRVIKNMKAACPGANFACEMQVKFDSNGGDCLETPESKIDAWAQSAKALL